METVALGRSGRTTTRLGFGSSSILGVLNRKQSLALLESAFDAGIRHFDTAPMYGYGEAESCVGEFLARHRGAATVTTKFGIAPQQQPGVVRAVRGVARPLLQRLPGLKARLQAPHKSEAGASSEPPKPPQANPIFTAENARRTLENSLVKLRAERVDVWLLHDVKAIDLADPGRSEPLLRFMEDAVLEGKIGAFGVGSDPSEISRLLAEHAPFCQVAQSEWSALNSPDSDSGVFRIYHRVLRHNSAPLEQRLNGDAELRARWSAAVGEDLAQPGMLARLMMQAAYLQNPESVLLFSSKSAAHIRENVHNVQDMRTAAAARRLLSLLQQE